MPAPLTRSSTASAYVPAHPALALKAAACCSMLTVLTTFLLWWLPRQVPATADFAATIALHQNPWYLSLLWVNFVHNWLALFGYIGAAAVLGRRAPGLAAGGLAAFFIWATTELVGISVILFAKNRIWRA